MREIFARAHAASSAKAASPPSLSHRRTTTNKLTPFCWHGCDMAPAIIRVQTTYLHERALAIPSPLSCTNTPSWSFPASATFSTPPCPQKTGASKSSLRVLLLAKTGAFQVSNSCPRNGGNECWRRNFSSESGAHGRHFEARKLTIEHDAAGCFVLWASRNRCLIWKVFCSVDRRARDGFWTKIAIPTCNRRASVKHDE